MRRFPLLILAVLAGPACRCGPKTHAANGQLQLTPTSVDFGGACVKPVNPALVVRPVTQTVLLTNVGVAPVDIASVEVDGGGGFSVSADAEANAAGATAWPQELEAGASAPLYVSFLPLSPGPASAALTVTDALGHSESAALSGTGDSTTPAPVTLLHCPGGHSGLDLCFDSATLMTSSNPLMWLPDTVAGDSSELDLEVGNAGCADLSVNRVTLDGGGDPLQTDEFVLLDPNGQPVPGGAYPPFTVPGVTADAGLQTVRLRFQPGIVNVFSDPTLTLSSNDPSLSPLTLHLLGSGVKPSLQLCTTGGGSPNCSSPTLPLTCDFTGNPACTGAFTLHNSGQAPLLVDSVQLTQSDPQFALSGLPAIPFTLTASGTASDTAPFTVSYTMRAQFDGDLLSVHSNAGVLRAIVQGGQPPHLTLLPASGDLPDTVDFNRDMSGNPLSLPNGFSGIKTFQIQNTGLSPLIVKQVVFADTNASTWPAPPATPIFILTPPPINAQVQPNATTPVGVAYADPPNGGPSGSAPLAAQIRVDTNDPLWPPPNGSKQVTVSAKTPCNPAPVAVVTGPATASASAVVTLDGSSSFDVEPDGSGSCQPGVSCTASPAVAGCRATPITHWQWKLASQPANPGGAVTLVPNGVGTTPTAQLQLGSCMPCSYVVRLTVYDDTPPTTGAPNGQPSAFTDFTVTVQQ